MTFLLPTPRPPPWPTPRPRQPKRVNPAEAETAAESSIARREAAAPVEPSAAGTFARARARRAGGGAARGCGRLPVRRPIPSRCRSSRTTDPCGPDLDLEGDAEFINFVAATEGLLPASYYAFNRDSIDFPAALQTAEKLLKRTLDIRLLALMAKLSILNRDVAGFARRLGDIAWLVSEHWEAAQSAGRGRRLFGAASRS